MLSTTSWIENKNTSLSQNESVFITSTTDLNDKYDPTDPSTVNEAAGKNITLIVYATKEREDNAATNKWYDDISQVHIIIIILIAVACCIVPISVGLCICYCCFCKIKPELAKMQYQVSQQSQLSQSQISQREIEMITGIRMPMGTESVDIDNIDIDHDKTDEPESFSPTEPNPNYNINIDRIKSLHIEGYRKPAKPLKIQRHKDDEWNQWIN